MDIQWEEPPEHAKLVGSGQQPGKYLPFAIALREHPGKWAVLPTETSSEKGAAATAQNIRRGKVKGFKAGEYETALDGTKIFVRYKGQPAKPEQARDDDPVEDDDERNAGRPLAADVRAWATAKGIDVPRAGRLPRELVDQYMEAPENQRTLRAVPHR